MEYQNPLKEKPLTFNDLDDILLNIPPQERKKYLTNRSAKEISPLFEYILYTFQDSQLVEISPSNISSQFQKVIKLPSLLNIPLDTTIKPKQFEIFRCPQTIEETIDNRWNTFCRRFSNAAKIAGLNKEFANALTGALDELAGNIIEHSKNVRSGIVGYRHEKDEFEFCIADTGIGVLRSLTANPTYSNIIDSGQALEIAIEDGESSKGRNLGYGFGFRELIHNIAGRGSIIRFRSGDHVLIIDGTLNIPTKRISKRINFQGFLISALCKNN